MNTYHFHGFEQINPHPDHQKLSKRLKYNRRKSKYQKHIHRFEDFVNSHAFYQQTFSHRPMNSYALLRVFMDCRLNFVQRFNFIRHDLITARHCFGHLLTHTDTFTLLSLDVKETQIKLVLEFNQRSTYEGFWALAIYQTFEQSDQQPLRIYQLSFAFMPSKQGQKPALMIGSIQGGNDKAIKDSIKTATKALHGMRPAQFLIAVMQLMAEQLNFSLYAINNQFHAHMRVYDRLTRKKQLFHTDYDVLWQKTGATQDKRGYWLMPSYPENKALSDIASKKRAMYRRRYAMMDDIQKTMAEHIKPFMIK